MGTQLPSPRGYSPLLQFSAHIRCGLRPNGGIDQDATWYGGRPRPRRHCVRWEPRSPPQNRGRSPPQKIFLAHVYYGQTAGWIKMALGMEIGLSPGDFVLNGDPARPVNLRPMFIIVIVISLEHCTGVRRCWFVQVQVKF